MPIYMKYGSVKGDVAETGHANWIELNSLHWGVGRGVSGSGAGSQADREAHAPSISEITVTKDLDMASVGLLTEAYRGDGTGDAATVQIDMCRTATGTGNMQVYQTFTLSQVIISGFSWSSGGERPSESLSLNFTTIATQFTPMNSDGTAGTPLHIQYNLQTAQAS